MPLNAASYADDLVMKAGKPDPGVIGPKGKRRRNWKGFYGSVHDIVGDQVKVPANQPVQLSLRGEYDSQPSTYLILMFRMVISI